MKTYIKQYYIIHLKDVVPPFLPVNIEMFYNNKKGVSEMYKILSYSSNALPTSTHKWNTIFDIETNEWKNTYHLPYKVLKSTKLQWFQTRINHRILGTNSLLNRINSNSNPNCTFCNVYTETIEHLFFGLSTCKDITTKFP